MGELLFGTWISAEKRWVHLRGQGYFFFHFQRLMWLSLVRFAGCFSYVVWHFKAYWNLFYSSGCSCCIVVNGFTGQEKCRRYLGLLWVYLKETTGSLEWLWPLLLEQSKAVKETNGLCFNSLEKGSQLVSKQVKKWEVDFEIQFRKQRFSPQATFFVKISVHSSWPGRTLSFCFSSYPWWCNWEYSCFLTVRNVSELKKKNALLFQVSSCEVSGRLPHEMYKLHRIYKFKFKSMY